MTIQLMPIKLLSLLWASTIPTIFNFYSYEDISCHLLSASSRKGSGHTFYITFLSLNMSYR